LAYVKALDAMIVRTYRRGVPAYEDPDTGEYVAHSVTKEVEFRLGIVAGEAIHNLRAALEYLVFALRRHDSPGKTFETKTQFSIEDCEKCFARRRKTYLKGVSDPHVATIEAYQPYKGCEWTRLLREISNEDKHREIKAVVRRFGKTQGETVVDLGEFELSEAGAKPLRPLVILPEDDIPTLDVSVYVNLRGTVDVAFPDGLGVIETLEEIQTQVRLVLETFGPEFDRPPVHDAPPPSRGGDLLPRRDSRHRLLLARDGGDRPGRRAAPRRRP